MKVKILELTEHNLDLQRVVQPEEIGLVSIEQVDKDSEKTEFTTPITLSLHLQKIGDKVWMSGKMATVVRTECVRCLQPLDLELKSDSVYVCFMPESLRPQKNDKDEDLVIDYEEEDVSYFKGEEIDLDEELRESLLVELPPYPHCVVECEPMKLETDKVAEAEIAAEKIPEWKKKLKNLKLDSQE